VIARSFETSTADDEQRIGMPQALLVRILKMMLAGIEVNEEWYIKTYPDVGQALKAGDVNSVQRHFMTHGYFEGRRPFPMRVDEAWYLRQNPDVAERVRRGDVASAQAHFDTDGYREGRPPFAL
jgi:hypothetical protein